MSERKRRRVIVGKIAAGELREALDHLDQQGVGGARSVLDKIDACIRRISLFPESSPVDPRAPPLSEEQPDAKGRATHAAGYTIRYAFPVRRGRDGKVVLILSIRHGRRRPLDNPDYVRRFFAELARLRSRASP